MAFRIESGIDPGNILAQQQPLPDPQVMEARRLALQNQQNEQSMFPLKKQGEELNLQSQQIALKEHQLGLQEAGVIQQTLSANGGDWAKSMPALSGKVRPKTLMEIQGLMDTHQEKKATTDKATADAAKANQEVTTQRREHIGELAQKVVDSNYNPAVADQFLTMLEGENPQLAQHMEGVRQQFQQDPNSIKTLIDGMVTQKVQGESQRISASKAQQASDEANAGLRTAEIPGAKAKSDLEVQQAAALKGMNDQGWQDYIDRVVEDHKSPLYRRTVQMVQFYRQQGNLKGADDAVKAAGEQLGKTESAVATAKATAPIKIDVAAQTAGARADMEGLTDDDYQRAGEQYMRTGVMPAMGRDSMTRGKIVHAGNQWARDNGFKPQDVVTMQAAYAGDKESLKKFQTQRDQIVSFEATAQKNLDLMLEKAKPLVDSGSPLLNKPLRSLNRNILGATEQAAFDAAMQVANNEVAKVTSGGGLSGVLSDSARHEIEGLNPKDATLGQYIAVAKVMKQDMANRHGSMDSTLSDIKARIGGGGAQQQQQTYKKTAVGQNGHRIGTNDNGQSWYDVQTGQKVQ